jgi:hypothetical protein
MTSTVSWWHTAHGDFTHDLVRYLVEHHVKTKIKNGILMDRAVFKKRTCSPCEPDVIFQYVEDGKKYIYVVEVESRLTNNSEKRKTEQYKEALAGITDLIILNLDEVKDWNNLRELKNYVEARMP